MTGDNAMDKLKGKGKEAVGKLTGDAKLQADGKTDQAAGTAQNLVGSIKDAGREALGIKPKT